MSDKNFKLNRTGLLYDPLMLDFYCEWDEQYPEKPDRILKPYERCEFYGLVDKCVKIEGTFCTDEDIKVCHTENVVNLMKNTENMSTDERKIVSAQYDGMFFHKNSNKAARFALGCSIDLLDNIMTNKVDNGFAIIRPPGHHAMHNEPNGYCYFNNACVVARRAIEKYDLKRILIVDWDVHHGQGSQFAFYNDPRVLYFSMHRYDFGGFWPFLRHSDFDYIGEKEGKGYNINIPLNKIGFGDSEYLSAFYNLLLPVAYEFQPELIIISSGYDAAIGCFEGKMRVTPACYAHLINSLSVLSNGKLCVLLEGGYCIKSLSEGVALSVRALLGYPTPRIEDLLKPDPVFVQTLLNLIAVLRPHWKCLQKLNDNDESIGMLDYLNKWDEDHRKDVKFYDYDNPPSTFDLTGFYPLYPEEDNIRLDKEIDKLIETTDLFVPENRTFIALNDENKIKAFKNISETSIQIIKPEKSGSLCYFAIENVGLRKFENGVALIQLGEKAIYQDLFDSACLAKSKFERFKKVLIVSFEDSVGLSTDDSILSISIGSKENNFDQNKNNIHLNIANLDEAGYITAFLRIIMPIAYKFNPDLVLVNVAHDLTVSTSEKLSADCLTQILKLLSALANGNIVLGFEDKSNLEQIQKLIRRSLLILAGDQCNSFGSPLIADDGQRDQMRQIIKNLKSDWDCFQFNENLPEY